jgi:mannose-6-phosphate isomerase-like protein (cupin superfamily)
MQTEETFRGANFTCFHAGPKQQWADFRLEPPAVPMPVRGKLFLQDLIGMTGAEISLNALPPGKAIPFLHKHRQNEEVYIVVGGRGQFIVDGQCTDVAEGTVLRIAPDGERAWRNNSDAPLYFLCIQCRADSLTDGGTSDGMKVEGKSNWAD